MSTAEVESQRIRLEAFFAERGVSQADAKPEIKRLLAKYSEPSTGGFDKMWRNLARKYDGGVSTTGGTAQDSTVALNKEKQYDDARIEAERDRLRQFYERYAPHKLPETDKNIKKYSRQVNGFDDMWGALARKYKVNLDDIPGASGSKTKGSKKSKGDREPPPPSAAALEDLANTTSMAESEETNRARLHRFYEKYAPHKVGEVSKQIAKYGDPATGGYARMWQQLVDKYVPEREREDRELANMLGGRDRPGRRYAPDVRDKWRKRLFKFYTYYAPEKGPQDIEDILDRYGPPNGYEEMWQQLVAKYGAEPIDPPSGFIGRFLDEEAHEEQKNEEQLFGGEHEAPTAASLERSAIGGVAGGAPSSPSPARPDRMSDTSSPPRFNRAASERSTDLSTNADPERYPYSPLGFNAIAVVLHALLRLQGATVMLYEKANEERQRNFRKAVEAEVALNLGIERRQVKVTAVKAGMSVELAIELTHEQVKHGVGEALVTRVLMGTFTVKHIRESYRRDLGGNPIQLHTEGAAIYGGACTPMFYDDAPHKPVEDPAQMLRTSTRDVAEHWAKQAAPEETVTPQRWDNGQRFARGSSIQGPAHGASPGTNASASPILSPPTVDGSPASPLRGWNAMPQRQVSSPPPHDAWKQDEERRNQRVLMNPHGLATKPSSAPDPTSSRGFLDQVWNDPPSSARPLPYHTTSKPVRETADGAVVAPGSVAHPDWKQRSRREVMKPVWLHHDVSTDDLPLPTRTAPPTVTHFRPEAAVNATSSTLRRMQDRDREQHADNVHASELMRAIRSPVEYQLEQSGFKGVPGGGPAVRSPQVLTPSYDTQPGYVPTRADQAAAHRANAFARDPRMLEVTAQRSPSAVLDPRYAPSAQEPADSQPRERHAATSRNPAYLMDIVEALEV